MLLLSWNVRYQGLSKRLEAVASAIGSVEPHIVTLQEVYSKTALDLTNALHRCGLPYVWHSHDPPCGDREVAKPYHCVIASCWPLATPPAGDAWRSRAPFPELLGRVLIRTATGDIDVLTVHIPSGAKHGWRKIDTFEVLARALRRGGDAPRILTGDFNEPRLFLTSGQIVAFRGDLIDEEGAVSIARGVKQGRPVSDWSKGVRSVLAATDRHGLRDAYRDRHGLEVATPVTHRVRRLPRCFDHTLVSRHFSVMECGYHHQWRRQNLSDHSAMWAELRLRGEVPPLTHWE